MKKEPARNRFKNIQILLSGGLDSTACLQFYLKNKFSVKAIFVDFGQASGKKELAAAKRIAAFYKVPLKVIEIRGVKDIKKGFIVGRNMLLLSTSLLTNRVKIGNIALGIHGGTTYIDCSELFLQKINQLFDLYTDGRINVVAPFINWTKSDIWSYIIENKIPHTLTYSCELGMKQPCGKCLSCTDLERLNAISKN